MKEERGQSNDSFFGFNVALMRRECRIKSKNYRRRESCNSERGASPSSQGSKTHEGEIIRSLKVGEKNVHLSV